jgi:hypothetical protein
MDYVGIPVWNAMRNKSVIATFGSYSTPQSFYEKLLTQDKCVENFCLVHLVSSSEVKQ